MTDSSNKVPGLDAAGLAEMLQEAAQPEAPVGNQGPVQIPLHRADPGTRAASLAGDNFGTLDADDFEIVNDEPIPSGPLPEPDDYRDQVKIGFDKVGVRFTPQHQETFRNLDFAKLKAVACEKHSKIERDLVTAAVVGGLVTAPDSSAHATGGALKALQNLLKADKPDPHVLSDINGFYSALAAELKKS
jgi:hypothetical protein